MCSQQNALFTYDLPHRSLISKNMISSDRTKLNVVEQKNSRNVVDGVVVNELQMEADLNETVNKNADLVLPGSNLRQHNNLQSRIQDLELQSTGRMQLSSDNRFLVVLNNEGVSLFETGRVFAKKIQARLDLEQMAVTPEYLKGGHIFVLIYPILLIKINSKIQKY